ncbi:hypothetical protein MMC07_009528 [Pseudocyphellaria aurata]|nr:hypothetical protein [Pseudocyphellaria aurata]
MFHGMRPEVLDDILEPFAKDSPGIKTVCEQITYHIVEPFFSGQKPGSVRIEANDPMGWDEFVPADLVQGHLFRSLGFVSGHTPLSSTSHGNTSSASVAGKKSEPDRDSASRDDSEVDEDKTEDDEAMTEEEDWSTIGAQGLRAMCQ